MSTSTKVPILAALIASTFTSATAGAENKEKRNQKEIIRG
jgi:hypothetical protein